MADAALPTPTAHLLHDVVAGKKTFLRLSGG
jgi:hypothetical protein